MQQIERFQASAVLLSSKRPLTKNLEEKCKINEAVMNSEMPCHILEQEHNLDTFFWSWLVKMLLLSFFSICCKCPSFVSSSKKSSFRPLKKVSLKNNYLFLNNEQLFFKYSYHIAFIFRVAGKNTQTQNASAQNTQAQYIKSPQKPKPKIPNPKILKAKTTTAKRTKAKIPKILKFPILKYPYLAPQISFVYSQINPSQTREISRG